MISDLKFIFSSKPVLAIFSLNILLRLFFNMFVLPDTYSTFGPDEGTYANLANFVSLGLPVTSFPLFGEGLYHTSKALVLPSAILIRLGFEQLLAVRTISSLYGITSCIVLALSYSAFYRIRYPDIKLASSIFKSKFLFLLAIFSFVPSNFLWSNLGLRESASQFWALTTFYLLLLTMKQKKSQQLISSFFIVCALVMLFFSRPQMGYLVSFTMSVALAILFFRYRQLFAGISLTAVLLGFLLGQSATVSSTFTLNPPDTKVDTSTGTSNGAGTFNGTGPIDGVKGILIKLAIQRSVNTLGAASALEPSKCLSVTDSLFALITCTLSEFPFGLFAFLFRPLLFYDKGSLFLNYAKFENLLWSILLISSLKMIFQRSQNPLIRFINISLMSYIVFFASSAALYEGNLGTAFRHKSSLLWPLIFILMIAPKILPKSRRETTTVS